MELISPVDSMFLLGESREHPMHVAGLQLFEPPEDAGPGVHPRSVPGHRRPRRRRADLP